MGVVLGLDGGGTKTVLALGDRSGTVLRVERAGSLDPMVDPNWMSTLGALFSQSGVPGADVEAAMLGMPCYGEIPELSAAQEREIGRHLPGGARIENDVRIAFEGALGGGGGVLILAGTGSMAWASLGGDTARQVRIGGWGEAFGDEGSAFWIGREALGEASRALDDRGPAKGLAAAVLERLEVDAGGLMAWAHGLPNRRSGFAALARLVSDRAEAGDPHARDILERAAEHLAAHGAAAWRALGTERPLAWSHAGGVFSSPLVLERLSDILGVAPIPPRLPPIGGALLGAARQAGWSVDDVFIERLGRSLDLHLRND